MSEKDYKTVVHELQVRFRDCDLLGHVNNSVYLTYFEETRVHFLKTIGHSTFDGFNFILARAEVDFRFPASLGQTLRIEMNVGKIRNSSFEFVYKITEKESGTLIAEGKTVQVMFDYAENKPFPIPEEVRTFLEQYQLPIEG